MVNIQEYFSKIKTFYDETGHLPEKNELKKLFNLKSIDKLNLILDKLENSNLIRKNFITKSYEFVNEEKTSSELIQVPLLGKIAAGSPIEAIIDESNSISLPQTMVSSRNVFALKVSGDSMVDSYIVSGDIVLCKRSPSANNGEIVVALFVDNTATLKKYYKEKNQIRLQPMNEKYPPIYTKKISIQGIVTAIIRKC